MNRLFMTRAATALAFTAISIPFSASAALNSPVLEDPAVTVSYSDLDLSSMDGVKTLYQRLKSSARKVCGGQKGIETIDRRLQRRECVDTALADAVEDIDNQLLDRLHLEKR